MTQNADTGRVISPGDRVQVSDPALAHLREIMRRATGEEPAPNHHGTVESVRDGLAIIIFDGGGAAPYPLDEVSLIGSSVAG